MSSIDHNLVILDNPAIMAVDFTDLAYELQLTIPQFAGLLIEEDTVSVMLCVEATPELQADVDAAVAAFFSSL